MKAYAQGTLAVFFVVLGVKMYGSKIDKNIDSNITQSRESILAAKIQSADLEELAELEMVETQNIQRRLAQLNETGEEDFATKLSQLDQLALELEWF